jgi:hypothetical protein
LRIQKVWKRQTGSIEASGACLAELVYSRPQIFTCFRFNHSGILREGVESVNGDVKIILFEANALDGFWFDGGFLWWRCDGGGCLKLFGRAFGCAALLLSFLFRFGHFLEGRREVV